MVEISQKLSKGFAVDEDIKFCEMTFRPYSGRIIFSLLKQNRIFGDIIKLPPKSLFPKKKLINQSNLNYA